MTGASGFLGRHVLAELARRSITTVAATRNPERLAEWRSSAEVLVLDIARPGPDTYARLGRPDVVIHLAWGGLPNYKSLHHFEQEMSQQYQFLAGLIEAGLSMLLVSGSCYEYGLRSGPIAENVKTDPENPYGFAKDGLRRQLEFLRRSRPFSLVWARLFYMYGGGQSSASVYSQLKASIARGDSSFDMSGGEQLRDYLPVQEVARLIVELAVRRKHTGPINVCSGKPVSVRNLVENWLVENRWNIALNFGRLPYPDYEPMAFWGTREYLDRVLED